MEDIVAVEVIKLDNKKLYFLTWGRVFDPVDEQQLLRSLEANLKKYGIVQYKKITLCPSLQKAVKAKYFYENFFLMSQKKIPFGRKYQVWRKTMITKIKQGKEIYFLGK